MFLLSKARGLLCVRASLNDDFRQERENAKTHFYRNLSCIVLYIPSVLPTKGLRAPKCLQTARKKQRRQQNQRNPGGRLPRRQGGASVPKSEARIRANFVHRCVQRFVLLDTCFKSCDKYCSFISWTSVSTRCYGTTGIKQYFSTDVLSRIQRANRRTQILIVMQYWGI